MRTLPARLGWSHPSNERFYVAHKARCVTCNDCFFRKTSLCALDLTEPCPTFRPALKGQMVAPRQARLVEPPPQFIPAAWLQGGRVAAGAA
jgi:hypothetical protein